jgi:hypothetical protein
VFRELSKLLAILAVILVGVITVMLTYQSLVGLAAFMGLIASATAPLSMPLLVAFWSITILVSAATMLQSAPGIWRKFSNWGQFLDNKIEEWWTGKEYYIDKANRKLKKSHKLIHSAQDDILLAELAFSVKTESEKQEENNQLLKRLNELKVENTPMFDMSTLTKLLKAELKLSQARNLLIEHNVADPEEQERDQHAGDAIVKAKDLLVNLIHARRRWVKNQSRFAKLQEVNATPKLTKNDMNIIPKQT